MDNMDNNFEKLGKVKTALKVNEILLVGLFFLFFLDFLDKNLGSVLEVIELVNTYQVGGSLELFGIYNFTFFGLLFIIILNISVIRKISKITQEEASITPYRKELHNHSVYLTVMAIIEMVLFLLIGWLMYLQFLFPLILFLSWTINLILTAAVLKTLSQK
jgi:hypothetical protein